MQLRKYRIRDLREDMDYLQKDLAKVLNVTQQQYSNIENTTIIKEIVVPNKIVNIVVK